ncbi:MAG: hypothetical protein ACXVAY_12680 [Mucilaginibacter sp.]
MRKFFFFLLLLIIVKSAAGQSESVLYKKKQLADKSLTSVELKARFLKRDFSSLFTVTDNSVVYGFIGDNYQRIRMKFITVTKDTLASDTYNVYGKSMVKNNVDEFHGTIRITNVRKLKRLSLGIDSELKNKGNKAQYIILGDYSFSENEKQSHSGVFKGTFRSNFYIDRNDKFHYDDIEIGDSYNNNQFVGIWAQYQGNLIKRCNWGDYRIPNSGDFDVGAGEFSPSKGDGWQSVHELWSADKKIKAKAKSTETAQWWQ